jgi:branched-chain amino acid transport system substrate-binding protein
MYRQLRSVGFTLLLACVLVLVSACQPGPAMEVASSQEGAGETYKIGALVAVTGRASSLGVPQRNTLEMLQKQIDAAGGVRGPDGLMHPVEIIVYDTESEETKAVLGAKKLIEEDNVALIIGPTQSGTALALVDTVQKAEVPLIAFAASIQIVEPIAERGWVFKTAPSDRLVVEALIEHLQQQGITNVAWMSVNTAFGDSGKIEFEAAAPGAGINLVTVEKFEATDTDMTPQLTKIRGTDAEALIIWSIPPSASAVTKNAYDLGLTLPIFHSHGVGNATFIELSSKEAVEGVMFPIGKIVVAGQLPDSDPQKTTLLGYVEEYEAGYREAPTTFGGHAWDGVYLALRVLEEVGPDRAAIRDALESTQGFVGIGGVFNFSTSDHNGLDTSAITMVRIVDGQWTWADD